MLWMALETRQHLLHGLAFIADLIDGSKQWKLVQQPLLLEDAVHFRRSQRSLELLPIQHLLLQLFNGLSSPGKGLGHPAVPAPIAGGDQVGHAAALQEGGCGHLALAEDLGEGDHFHESQADDGSFGVVSAVETVAEARSHRYDVLQSTTELNSICVLNHRDAKIWSLQKFFEEKAILHYFAADGGLTELLRRHLVGNVGSHQHTDVNAHLLSDDVGDEFQALGALVYALDERDSPRFLGHFPGDLVADSVDELVGNDEHQHVCIPHGLLEVWDSNHIVRQLVSREIFHILMVIIYDVCQFSPINHFFKDPHVDRGGELLKLLDIITNYFCNCGTPVPRAHDAHFQGRRCHDRPETQQPNACLSGLPPASARSA